MEDLIAQINRLSLRDTKSLSQKGLKAAEEVGELAKAILPYEGARGTNHRVPSSEKVVEECADTFLVIYSILRDLGCSLGDFQKMVQRKADYWEFLLDNEDKSDLDNLDFEVHITVASVSSVEAFTETCRDLGVKPIILDLYVTGEPIKDVMTSSTMRGSTKAAIHYTKKLAADLRARGFEVLREKIETVPWHPAALVRPINQSAYFEAHFAFIGDDKAAIIDFANRNSIHLSRNRMKKAGDTVIMGTFRVDALDIDSERFVEAVGLISAKAIREGLTIKKTPHTEYSLFDTNEQHDREWIAASR